jgi:hypothetical protein
MLIRGLDLLSLSQDYECVLNALESYSHILFQSSSPSLLVV